MLAAGLVWVAWTAISLWLSFRAIDRIEVGDLDAVRSNIENMPQEERPPPPPLEPDPDDVEPVGDPAPTTAPVTSGPPEDGPDPTIGPIPDFEPDPRGNITGVQIPYDVEFDKSPPIPDEAFNAFLILGSDTRTGRGGQRADVIILALLPSDGTPPILVSLPRDLWVKIPCWESRNRINAALNGCGDVASGPELMALTVADFTGIQPDHFALFDFEDFKRVIDAFGGIEICVEYPVRDGALNLPAGCTNADGEQALGWVRSRKTKEFRNGAWRTMRGGVNDLTRNERQRDVLLQLLGKVKSFDSITSLTRRVDSISDAVTIDDGITLTGAIGLAWDLRSVSPAEVKQVTIPIRFHRTEGGASVLLPTRSFADVFAEVWQPSD